MAVEMVATRPSDMLSLFVYKKPPPTLPCVQSPTNSMAAPSPSGQRKRSSIWEAGSSNTCLMPTAIWLGLGRGLPRHFSDSRLFTPSASTVTCAVISSSPARTPTTLPLSSRMSSSTAMPQMYSAPASSAFEASHWSKGARRTL